MMCILDIQFVVLEIVQWNDWLVLVIPSRNLQDFAADLHKFETQLYRAVYCN